jgi:hypothetical protein
MHGRRQQVLVAIPHAVQALTWKFHLSFQSVAILCSASSLRLSSSTSWS